MVCACARLHADDVSYAGFPNGIPEGLPFGTFLGRQSEIFMCDMGFDYLWLSNGFGFGRETWSTLGAIFDGENFHAENFSDVKRGVLDFWTLFRKECSYPVATRGTNMTMGIDNGEFVIYHILLLETQTLCSVFTHFILKNFAGGIHGE